MQQQIALFMRHLLDQGARAGIRIDGGVGCKFCPGRAGECQGAACQKNPFEHFYDPSSEPGGN